MMPSQGEPLRGEPTLYDAEEINQAVGLVGRFHKVFLRTIKALGDKHRSLPHFVVGSAGQVNLAGQHVNLDAAKCWRGAWES
jgi:hypothetical protein